jgi:hypothetical protein
MANSDENGMFTPYKYGKYEDFKDDTQDFLDSYMKNQDNFSEGISEFFIKSKSSPTMAQRELKCRNSFSNQIELAKDAEDESNITNSVEIGSCIASCSSEYDSLNDPNFKN